MRNVTPRVPSIALGFRECNERSVFYGSFAARRPVVASRVEVDARCESNNQTIFIKMASNNMLYPI